MDAPDHLTVLHEKLDRPVVDPDVRSTLGLLDDDTIELDRLAPRGIAVSTTESFPSPPPDRPQYLSREGRGRRFGDRHSHGVGYRPQHSPLVAHADNFPPPVAGLWGGPP